MGQEEEEKEEAGKQEGRYKAWLAKRREERSFIGRSGKEDMSEEEKKRLTEEWKE